MKADEIKALTEKFNEAESKGVQAQMEMKATAQEFDAEETRRVLAQMNENTATGKERRLVAGNSLIKALMQQALGFGFGLDTDSMKTGWKVFTHSDKPDKSLGFFATEDGRILFQKDGKPSHPVRDITFDWYTETWESVWGVSIAYTPGEREQKGSAMAVLAEIMVKHFS